MDRLGNNYRWTDTGRQKRLLEKLRSYRCGEIRLDELLSGNENLGYFESKCDIRKIIEIVKEYIN